MAYVRVNDPFLDSEKSARSVDMKQLRDNQDYHDSVINTFASRWLMGNNVIADDFLGVIGSALGSWWVTNVGAGDTATIQSEHSLRLLTNGNAATDFVCVTAADQYFHPVKTEEYTAIFETRVKKITAGAVSHFAFGFKNNALAKTDGSFASSHNDCVEVYYVSGFDLWTVNINNAGSGNNFTFGNPNVWQTIRLEMVCSATTGNRNVRCYLNNSLVVDFASSFGQSTAEGWMPTTVLCPFSCIRGDTLGAASRELRHDWIVATPMTRPSAA